MNILPAAVFVLAATTLLPYAAAQPLRHGSGTGSDASGISAKFIAVSDAVAVPLGGTEPPGVLVGASTHDARLRERDVQEDGAKDGSGLASNNHHHHHHQDRADVFVEQGVGRCDNNNHWPSNRSWYAGRYFVWQGVGRCTNSNGGYFSRINYNVRGLYDTATGYGTSIGVARRDCEKKCYVAPFHNHLVGFEFHSSTRACVCRFDNGADINNSDCGDGTCPSNAADDNACASAPAPNVGPVAGSDDLSGWTCYRLPDYVAPIRVDIIGIAGYHDLGEGLYFKFEPSQFQALGIGLEQGGIYTVKQCGEDGVEIWSGSISVGTAYGPWYGRRLAGYATGQWSVTDYIVNPDTACFRNN